MECPPSVLTKAERDRLAVLWGAEPRLSEAERAEMHVLEARILAADPCTGRSCGECEIGGCPADSPQD